jgi:hypothetical protein
VKFVQKFDCKISRHSLVGTPMLRREYNIGMNLKEIRMDIMDFIEFRLGTCRTVLNRATHL